MINKSMRPLLGIDIDVNPKRLIRIIAIGSKAM